VQGYLCEQGFSNAATVTCCDEGFSRASEREIGDPCGLGSGSGCGWDYG